MLDRGIITICSKTNTAANGAMPREVLSVLSKHFYEERTIGYGRQYAAKGVNEFVDLLARIWYDGTIRIGMYAVLDDTGEQFRIDNVQHMFNDDGLRVTDLTLSRMEDYFDVINESGNNTSAS